MPNADRTRKLKGEEAELMRAKTIAQYRSGSAVADLVFYRRRHERDECRA